MLIRPVGPKTGATKAAETRRGPPTASPVADKFAATPAAAPAPAVAPVPLTGVSLPPPRQPEAFTRGGYSWIDPFAGFERETLASQIWVAAKNREAQDYFGGLPIFERIKAENALPAPAPPGTPAAPPPAEADTSRLDLNNPATWSVDGSTMGMGSGKSPDERWTAMLVGRNGGDGTTLVLSPTGGAPTEFIDQARGLPQWMPDSSGFFYTVEPWRSSATDEDRPGIRDVRFHKMGTPVDQDPVVFQATGDATRTVAISTVGPYLSVKVSHGWGDDDVYLRELSAAGSSAPFRPLAARPNTDTNTLSWAEGRMLMQTSEGANRYRLVQIDPQHPEPESWKTIIPEHPSAVLTNYVISGGRVVAFYEQDGSQFAEIRGLDGALLPGGEESMRVKGLPDLGYLHPSAQKKEGEVRFAATTLTQPWQKYTLDVNDPSATAQMEGPSTADPRMKDLVTERVMVTSKDGTKVPMFVVHHKDVPLDGNNPTLLEGYGGFLTSIALASKAKLLPFFRRGGVYALTAVRGGDEYGESWHEDGSRERKQHSVDDFLASAEALISAGYTNPSKLGINGTSNGGLLMGAAITQRPDLFKAAVMGVPLTDMLRYDTGDRGKTWVPEYGDPDQPEQMQWLLGYSPYQHVDPNARYPAVMIASGGGDDRVSPWHSQKMSARLHGLTRGPNLLRTGEHAGHGYDDLAEELAFLCDQLGMPLEPTLP